MIKKGATLVSVLALLFTMLTFAAFSASAATVVSVKHDFAGYTDGDTGALSLVKIFKGLESADHARIKYAFGKGYLCPDGGGVTCSLVYKLETGGKKLSSLDMTVKAHFVSRAGYNPDWTQTPQATVEVSTDGAAYTKVATWEGERVEKADYPADTDYSKLTPKTYTANLLSAAGSASTVYVRLSWNVYDFPLYSSVHSVEIVGNDGSGGDTPAPTEPPVTQAPTTEATEPEVTETQAASQPETTAPAESEPVSQDSAATTSKPVQSDASAGEDDGKGGFPVAAVVAIVVVCILAAGGGIVYLLYKKGVFAKK